MNNELIIELHPLLLVESIITRYGTALNFTYSFYEVAEPGRQAVAPRSDVLKVRAADVTPDWVVDRFRELKSNEELAWHSWVEREERGFHIPMIDLVGRPSVPRLRELSRMVAASMHLNSDFVFFETGQSLHGYLPELIPEASWHRYLGELLVLDQRDWPHLIDTRWVGHALARGFSALRWSKNTDRYRAMPRLVNYRGHQHVR